MVAPLREVGVIEDGDVTRTGIADGSDGPLPALAPDRVVAPLQYRDPDRYELLGEHGRGGIGRVQRAHDKELGRNVAIKELIKRGDIGEVRFLREAMITARLEHPGIVPIHEAGRWPDGTPFYVMKLVAGRSLKELIEERATVDERIGLLHHVIAVADAVAYAHERDIIHRDLKPANVIAGDFGETVVIDWGLAKDLQASDGVSSAEGPYRTPERSDLTVVGSVLGTPLYMSPEQSRGEWVDQRTDVYAIGAMLWQLCSLEPVPPTTVRERERMLRHARIDRDLIAIITKALAADSAMRYRNAGELAADLKAFKSGARIAARDYSLVAMLAHWIRRHRVIALMVAITTTLAIAGSVMYVRNIANARDRADAAAARAETQRLLAASERDHARLAEASAVLDKDPTRARQVLEQVPLHTPQYALLRGRADLGAATRVLDVPGGILRMLRDPLGSDVVFVSNTGNLTRFDVDRGELEVLDHDVPDLIAHAGDGWVYVRKPFAPNSATLASTRNTQTVALGSLFSSEDTRLVAAGGETYALDHGSVYRIESSGPVLVRRDVRSIAGSDRVLMVCTTAGELEVTRDRVVERRGRCADNDSVWPMAAVGADYAALESHDTLLIVRDGTPREVPATIAGEYELALAASGLVAIADFDGKSSFVRPGGERLELAPPHGAHALSVAADGDIAAWGFDDGLAIALDTRTGQVWRLVGHGTPVSQLAVDARNARLFTVGGAELRVWPLQPSPFEQIQHLPCLAFNATRSADGKRIALDCSDGAVREWSLETGAVRVVHRHDGVAHGLLWLGDEICSGGFDGRVLCTAGSQTRELRPLGTRIRRLALSPRGTLVIASEDGAISELGGATLYRHTAVPYALAFSPDGQRLASGASNGTLIVYDLVRGKVRGTVNAHVGLVTSVAFQGEEIWTSGLDGAIKRWRDDGGSLTELQTIAEPSTTRFLHLFEDGWSAITGGRVLVVQRAGREIRIDLDRNVERCEVSADERYIAAATPGEVVVIDLVRGAVANVPMPASRHGYVGFVNPGFLTISDASGLVTVPLAALEYVDYTSLPMH
jgi:hypothetical protein